MTLPYLSEDASITSTDDENVLGVGMSEEREVSKHLLKEYKDAVKIKIETRDQRSSLPGTRTRHAPYTG